MKVCVTIGNGFIGSVVVRLLITNGHTVRCILRKPSNTARIAGLNYERIEGDVRDAASTRATASGCWAVIHLAYPSSWNDINSPLLESVVHDGTINVLEAVNAAGARVVFCSSASAVNGSAKPIVFNEATLFASEDPKLRYSNNKHAVIVNPREVYGPQDTAFISTGNLVDFAKSKPVFVCHGGTSIVYVGDVALGIVRAMEKGRSGERYILSGQNLTVRELAELTLKLLGVKRKVVTLPTGLPCES